MSEDKKKPRENTKLKKITKKEVKDFIEKTGFVLEMDVAEFLKKKGFTVKVNHYFLDLESEKKREIDIIATKQIGKINVSLVIECKQSLKNTWVFVCSDKKPSRFYRYVKHTPTLSLSRIHKSELFNKIAVLSREVSIAQNYSVFETYTKKPADNTQIDKAIEKLPKAVIDAASLHVHSVEKHIYIPIVIFNGQIFSTKYDGKINVEEEDFLYYGTEFSSDSYDPGKQPAENQNNVLQNNRLLGYWNPEKRKLEKIRKAYSDLGKEFAVCFVNREKLDTLLQKIENDVLSVSARKWSINLKK